MDDPQDDPLAPLPLEDDELEDDDGVILDPKKILPIDPEEDHESADAMADEEDEDDMDLDEDEEF
jgi:hypothetical protein